LLSASSYSMKSKLFSCKWTLEKKIFFKIGLWFFHLSSLPSPKVKDLYIFPDNPQIKRPNLSTPGINVIFRQITLLEDMYGV
jgi:hypothetical protein